MNKKGRFVYNALMLVGVSLIMRSIGMYFNVYISNKVGAEALGVYSLVGGVYGFGITLATSGINLAVTRLVSEALGKEQLCRIGLIMRRCVAYALTFGMLAMMLILTLSERIAYGWLDDLRTITPLRILAVSLPLISVASALNGYFTAVRKVYKNALTVFLEQGVRIFCTVYLLTALLPSGIEYACLSLAGGSLAAELVSLIILSSLYYLDPDRRKRIRTAIPSDRGQGYMRALLGITLPVALSSYVRSGLLTLEHSLIPTGLRKSGTSAALSLSIYGTLHSMVFPVLLFPAVFLTSFSGLLVPELAESRALGDRTRIARIVRRIMRFSLLFSIGAGIIMFCFAYELGSSLYKSSEYAGRYIALLAPLVPIMYLDSMTDVMLKGLGQQFYSMTVNIADSLFSVILVWLLLPKYGIYAYIFIIYAAELLNTALSIARLLIVTRVKPDIVNWIVKPLLAVAGATSIVRIFTALSRDELSGAGLTYAILASAVIYILLLLGLFSLEKKDIAEMRGFIDSIKPASRKTMPPGSITLYPESGRITGSETPPQTRGSQVQKSVRRDMMCKIPVIKPVDRAADRRSAR